MNLAFSNLNIENLLALSLFKFVIFNLIKTWNESIYVNDFFCFSFRNVGFYLSLTLVKKVLLLIVIKIVPNHQLNRENCEPKYYPE